MANAARLPEVFDFQGLAVRCFPAEWATGFPRLSQAVRRAIPAIVRRLYKAAAIYAAEDADCLICGEAAPIEGRLLVAVETDGGHELGVVCADCARLAELDARTQS